LFQSRIFGSILVVTFTLGLGFTASCSDSDSATGPSTDNPDDGSEGPVLGQWPQFGHDAQSTRASEDTTLSPENVTNLEKKWSIDLRGCTSTPAVVDGVVYVGDWFGNVRALNADTGKEVWAEKVSDGSIDDSPLVANDRVYIADGVGNLFALHQDTGKVDWEVDLDDSKAAHIYSSPTLVEGMILIGVASLEVVLGEPFTFYGNVVALDADTGDEVWRTYLTGPEHEAGAGVSIWSSFSVDAELGYAYIGTGQGYEEPASKYSDALVAVDYRNEGKIVWGRQYTADDVFTIRNPAGPDFDIGATPTVYDIDGQNLVAVGDKGGVFAAFNRADGTDAWSEPVRLSEGSAQGGVMVSSAFANGVLFVSSNEFRPEGGGALDEPLEGDVHIDYAINAATGEVIWKKESSFPSVGGMAWTNGIVFNSSTDGTLYARDASSGEILWSDMPAGEDREVPGRFIASGASIAEGKVFTCHGFSFFKTASSGIIDGGLVAYGLE